MRLTVQLAGVNTVDLRTKALIAAARRGMSDGLSEGAQMLVEEAQTLVPVDTGRLRDSIHAELVEATETRIQVVVTPAYDEPNEYGFEPAYARRIEYGFVGEDRLGRHYHQAASPYLRPAWDGKINEIRETIRQHVYEELDSELARSR
jgi:hypothetical protein